MELQIKICGITSADQAVAIEAMGFDFIGFIFYPLSKRYAGNGTLRLEAIGNKMISTSRTAVFVNPTIEEIQTAIACIPGLSVLQFHGEETPEFCALFAEKFTIIKAFQISENTAVEAITRPYAHCCAYFLFDTKSDQYGGTGKKFNWEILKNKTLAKPFFLSGGISETDLNAIREFQHPSFFGIDINSCFEKEPGVKDMQQLQHFIQQLKVK